MFEREAPSASDIAKESARERYGLRCDNCKAEYVTQPLPGKCTAPDCYGCRSLSRFPLSAPSASKEAAREHWRGIQSFPKEIIRKLSLSDCMALDDIIVDSHAAFASAISRRAELAEEHLQMANSRRDEITADLEAAQSAISRAVEEARKREQDFLRPGNAERTEP